MQITQDLKNNENLEHPFVDIAKYKTFAKSMQKFLNDMVAGAQQSCQFFKH